MIPCFLLKVQRRKEYSVFNPVDNDEYVVNYAGVRILESCDGAHTLEQIASAFAKEFEATKRESSKFVTSFLASMTKRGMISWRDSAVGNVADYGPPDTVFWDITSQCNLRCVHCYFNENRSGPGELPTDEIQCGIEEMASYGVANLVISGGEPMLRRDALEIVSHAASLTFSDVSLVTNGTLIDNQAAKTLKRCGANVQISIDGDTASLHDTIRGVKGAFDAAIAGIRLLQKKKVPGFGLHGRQHPQYRQDSQNHCTDARPQSR